MINAGPELTQNASINSAFDLLICLFTYAFSINFAPTGNPPINDIRYIIISLSLVIFFMFMLCDK